MALLAPHVAAQTVSSGQSAQSSRQESTLQEVIVTASRRATDISDIPYNISAVSGDDLTRTNTTDLASLARQIPGFTYLDRGPRFAAATVPIIRGLNASDTSRRGLVQEQMPVGSYIGNSSAEGYFPLDDVQRVEVLRGPQGTLFGAGALGGTIRLIPNDPKLGEWSADVNVGGSVVAHSSDLGYTGSALVNMPLGEIAALRLSGKYDNQPGFIDQKSIIRRVGDPNLSAPVLAAPGDVANSSAVYYDDKDMNEAEVRNFRASLLVEPTSGFSVNLAYNRAKLEGTGGPETNPRYAGGLSPFDARITLPASDSYSLVSLIHQPYSRLSQLTSLDMSFDLGFATLSSTSSYLETEGVANVDVTGGIFALPPGLLEVYVGDPVSPRFVDTSVYDDQARGVMQELRLVSNDGDGPLSYVAGAYYEKKKKDLSWDAFAPGLYEQGVASGGMPPLTLPPYGRQYHQVLHDKFTDKSLYGELTWHMTKRLDATVGTRVFWQEISQRQGFTSDVLDFAATTQISRSTQDHIVKANLSYEFSDGHRAYATFSQGYRRGGGNAVPTDGFLQEPAALLVYEPDTANNYEIGIKGRLASGLRYSADVFYIDWQHPQIGSMTPVSGFPVVVNVPDAQSRGVEFEVHTPLFSENLEVGLDYAYADATLLEGFCIPVGDGGGGVIPCGITGQKDARLPGNSRHSGSVTVSYRQDLGADAGIDYSLNATYKSDMVNNLQSSLAPIGTLPAYTLLNASASFDFRQMTISAFCTNLLDRRVVFTTTTRDYPVVGDLVKVDSINRPREIGVRFGYHF
ncbi:MAG: TonB-dependent receptor [Pseudomonadota bacterium]|nr:TonB-dependent receptor [Pseudomonadota bacterium]